MGFLTLENNTTKLVNRTYWECILLLLPNCTKASSLCAFTTPFPCKTLGTVKPLNKLKLPKNELKNKSHDTVLYWDKSLDLKLSTVSSDWQWLSKVSRSCLEHHQSHFNLERPELSACKTDALLQSISIEIKIQWICLLLWWLNAYHLLPK